MNGESCYHLFGEETNSRNFDEAREYCQSQGGDLVTFSSLDEENLMYNVIPYDPYDDSPYWIGMQRKEEANSSSENPVTDYQWVDGTLSDYRNFESNDLLHDYLLIKCIKDLNKP